MNEYTDVVGALCFVKGGPQDKLATHLPQSHNSKSFRTQQDSKEGGLLDRLGAFADTSFAAGAAVILQLSGQSQNESQKRSSL